MARTMLSGCSDWRSKILISWGRPSSVILKSSLESWPTMAPFLSVTLTQRLTSLVSMRKVGPSWACVIAARNSRTKATQDPAHAEPEWYSREDFPSGAKALLTLVSLMYGLKPVPFFLESLMYRLRPVPFFARCEPSAIGLGAMGGLRG